MAVLSVIGGLDDRPRVGGVVQHEELGIGTITGVPSRTKVVVFFHGRKTTKLCPLSALKAVRAYPHTHARSSAHTVCLNVTGLFN